MLALTLFHLIIRNNMQFLCLSLTLKTASLIVRIADFLKNQIALNLLKRNTFYHFKITLKMNWITKSSLKRLLTRA